MHFVELQTVEWRSEICHEAFQIDQSMAMILFLANFSSVKASGCLWLPSVQWISLGAYQNENE